MTELYDFKNLYTHIGYVPIPVAARSKAGVCGRSHAGIAGSNPTGVMEVFSCVVCCQVEVSTSG
jgi:hypothetical protein